jgi:hypothetical protein
MLTRASSALPCDQIRKKRVVTIMANRFTPEILAKPPEIVHREKVSTNTKEIVAAFYLREDISRMCPGKRDVVHYKDNMGNRIQHQKMHLTMSLSEAHKLFIEEFGRLIRFSFFASLRPAYILPYRNMPLNICTCKIHEDFIA